MGYKVYDVLRGQSSPCVQSSMDVISDSILFSEFWDLWAGISDGRQTHGIMPQSPQDSEYDQDWPVQGQFFFFFFFLWVLKDP